MKTILVIAIIIVLILNGAFAWFAWQKRQSDTTPTSPSEITTPSEKPLGEKILLTDMDISTLDEKAKAEVESLITAQVNEHGKLFALATAAGTTLDKSAFNFAWQRALYDHGGETGLADYLATLGTTEADYKKYIEEKVIVTTFLAAQTEPIPDEAVTAYYQTLPAEESDDFDLIKEELRQNLYAEAVAATRARLLETSE